MAIIPSGQVRERTAKVLSVEVVMLTVFGDESVDSTQQKVFATAALLGDENQWKALREKWLQRMNGRIFHAADCEGGYRDFKDTSHTENLALYKDLTTILAKSGLIGFGVAIDLVGLKKYFPDVREENPYISCFLRTVKFLAEKARLCVPSSGVEVTFDQHPTNEYNAGLIYQYMKLDGDWSAGSLLAEKVSFASRKEPGIQAADLWAREVMKYLERYLENMPTRTTRKSMLALEATNLFGADYLMEEFYKSMRVKYQELVEMTGVAPSAYLQWLAKRHDNQSNRILFIMATAQQEQQAKGGIISNDDANAKGETAK
jgi:hypothetical protein